jgi:hypothetical protein
MIGSATYNGALHLVHTSFTPVTALLETAKQLIARAYEAA